MVKHSGNYHRMAFNQLKLRLYIRKLAPVYRKIGSSLCISYRIAKLKTLKGFKQINLIDTVGNGKSMIANRLAKSALSTVATCLIFH